MQIMHSGNLHPTKPRTQDVAPNMRLMRRPCACHTARRCLTATLISIVYFQSHHAVSKLCLFAQNCRGHSRAVTAPKRRLKGTRPPLGHNDMGFNSDGGIDGKMASQLCGRYDPIRRNLLASSRQRYNQPRSPQCIAKYSVSSGQSQSLSCPLSLTPTDAPDLPCIIVTRTTQLGRRHPTLRQR